jgi:YggT family protein
MLYALFGIIDMILQVLVWIIIAQVILSWLVAFNVINTRNSFVNQIGGFLYRATEPALRPIRNVLPSLGGIDISPMILILLLIFARRLLWQMFA